MDFTTGLAILGAVKTVLDLGEKVYRFGTTFLKKSPSRYLIKKT